MMEKKRDAKCCYIFSFTIAFYKLRLVHLGNENLFKVLNTTLNVKLNTAIHLITFCPSKIQRKMT